MEKYNLTAGDYMKNPTYALIGDLYLDKNLNSNINSPTLVYGINNSFNLDSNLIIGKLNDSKLEFYSFMLDSNRARAYSFDIDNFKIEGIGEVFSINDNKYYFNNSYLKMLLNSGDNLKLNLKSFENLDFEGLFNSSLFKEDKEDRFKFIHSGNLEIKLENLN